MEIGVPNRTKTMRAEDFDASLRAKAILVGVMMSMPRKTTLDGQVRPACALLGIKRRRHRRCLLYDGQVGRPQNGQLALWNAPVHLDRTSFIPYKRLVSFKLSGKRCRL